MASLRSLLLVSFLMCFMSTLLAMPFHPDNEDDENENELNAGKFEDNFEDIPDDEEVIEESKDDDLAFKDEDEELDAEEEEDKIIKDDDDDEEDISKEEAVEEDIAKEIAIEEDIAKDEAISDYIAKEAAIDEEIAKDQEDKIFKDDYHKVDEIDVEDEEPVFPPGGTDDEEIEKPGFFRRAYEKAKQFLRKITGHY